MLLLGVVVMALLGFLELERSSGVVGGNDTY